MTADTLFMLANYSVMPFWLLLIVAPRAKITDMLVHSGLVPMVLGITYSALLLNSMVGDTPEGAGMGSLDALMISFSQPMAVVTGWVHYLAFDLFVGAWIARDAARMGIHHFSIILPLLLTFAAGPAGLLFYLLLRYAWKRRFQLTEVTISD